MAGKKGAAVQLQQEVSTEEEWESLVQKPGLIVVDIYSGWCGPCVGMVGNLKKIKLDIGGDMLLLAIAKADGIPCLERFRNKSEPTWMFVAGGKVVNLMLGANSPRLMQMIADELQKETEVQKGHRERDGVSFHHLMPEEIQRAEHVKQKEDAKKAQLEATEKQEQDKKFQQTIKLLIEELKYDTVVVCFPFVYNEENNEWPPMDKLMEAVGTSLVKKMESVAPIQMEIAEKLFGIFDEELIEELREQLEKGPCLARLIGVEGKHPTAPPPEEESEEAGDIALETSNSALLLLPEYEEEGGGEEEGQDEEDVTDLVHSIIYGHPPTEEVVEEEDEAPPCILAQVLVEYADVSSLPGIWAPANARDKAEAVVLLFPAYVQDIMGPEPEPLPPHVAVVFDAGKFPEIAVTLTEYQDDIINSGFFDGADPNTARKIAASYNEFHLVTAKTGNEKFVVMLNNTKSEALLDLAQFTPKYISQTTDEGKEDCEKFFPATEEEKEREITEASKPYEQFGLQDFDEITFGSAKDLSGDLSEYDPLALREKVPSEITEILSLVSGLEMAEIGAHHPPEDEKAAEKEGKPGDAQAVVEETVKDAVQEAVTPGQAAEVVAEGAVKEAVAEAVGEDTGGVAEGAVKDAVAEAVGEDPGAGTAIGEVVEETVKDATEQSENVGGDKAPAPDTKTDEKDKPAEESAKKDGDDGEKDKSAAADKDGDKKDEPVPPAEAAEDSKAARETVKEATTEAANEAVTEAEGG